MGATDGAWILVDVNTTFTTGGPLSGKGVLTCALACMLPAFIVCGKQNENRHCAACNSCNLGRFQSNFQGFNFSFCSRVASARELALRFEPQESDTRLVLTDAHAINFFAKFSGRWRRGWRWDTHLHFPLDCLLCNHNHRCCKLTRHVVQSCHPHTTLGCFLLYICHKHTRCSNGFDAICDPGHCFRRW